MRLAFASQRQQRTAKAKSELNEPLGSNPFTFYMTKAAPKGRLSFNGRRAGIRTLDPLIKSQLL